MYSARSAESSIRVLLCDDSRPVRLMMERLLHQAFARHSKRELDLTILGATPEEVRTVTTVGPAFHMIVCDLNLGTLDDNGNDLLGSDIARSLRLNPSWNGLFVLQTESPPDVMAELSKDLAIDLLLDKETGLWRNADEIVFYYEERAMLPYAVGTVESNLV